MTGILLKLKIKPNIHKKPLKDIYIRQFGIEVKINSCTAALRLTGLYALGLKPSGFRSLGRLHLPRLPHPHCQPCKPNGLLIRAGIPSFTAGTLCAIPPKIYFELFIYVI